MTVAELRVFLELMPQEAEVITHDSGTIWAASPPTKRAVHKEPYGYYRHTSNCGLCEMNMPLIDVVEIA